MKISLLLLLALPVTALPLAAQDEKPFQAIPLYKAPAFSSEDEVGDRKLIQLDKPTIDSIAGFLQGFFKKYHTIGTDEIMADESLTAFLTEDYVQRLKRAQRIAKMSRKTYYLPWNTTTDDLYKFIASFTTGEKDQYIIHVAVGDSKSDEMIYTGNVMIVVKKQGDSWLISDLRDMGNG